MLFKAKNLWFGPAFGIILTILTIPYSDSYFFSAVLAIPIIFFFLQIIVFAIVDKIRYAFFPAYKADKELLFDILSLAAALLKTTNIDRVYEKQAMQNKLRQDFGPKRTAKYMLFFEEQLNKDIPVRIICKRIDYSHPKPIKKELLSILIELAVADKLLEQKEIQFLQYARKCFGLSDKEFKRALSSRKFKFEYESHQKQSQNQQQQKPTKTRLIQRAYDTLGLKENTSISAIKKAYRKLAKKHHPDKFAHLGSFYQNQATDKFQLIANAYSLLKKQRNF